MGEHHLKARRVLKYPSNSYSEIYLSRTTKSRGKLCIYIGAVLRNHLGIHSKENKTGLDGNKIPDYFLTVAVS